MVLSQQEIHQIGMNLVGKHLVDNGFEFLAIKSELVLPQFVCLKNEKELFCPCCTVIFPKIQRNMMTWMLKMKKHAIKKSASFVRWSWYF